MKNRWDIYIHSLEQALQACNVSKEDYSIGQYKEEAVCMEMIDRKWYIYDGERGNRYHMQKADSIRGACACMIVRIAASDEEAHRIKASYLHRVDLARTNQKIQVGAVKAVARSPMTKKVQTRKLQKA